MQDEVGCGEFILKKSGLEKNIEDALTKAANAKSLQMILWIIAAANTEGIDI